MKRTPKKNPNAARRRRLTSTAVLLLIVIAASFASGATVSSTCEAANPDVGAGPSNAPVSFRNDVSIVLSKAGCNAGTCHGNFQGKGGFRLSLRGEDPNFDYQAIARDQLARRINPLEPASSLVLLKATGRASHLGGVRFHVGSVEEDILRRWVAAGAPGPLENERRIVTLEVTPAEAVIVAPSDDVQLKVIARYSNGDCRDLTNLAVYEPTSLSVRVTHDGRVERLGFGEATVIVRVLDQQVAVPLAFIPDRVVPSAPESTNANYVDREITAKLERLRIAPAPVADTSTLVRRVYMDVLGVLPTPEEANILIDDSRPDAWDRLVDQLLARPEFAEQWALHWADVLRIEDKVLDSTGVEKFHGWLKSAFARGVPLDSIVRDLVSSRGSTYENPPSNYYRALREPDARAETTARLFLGVRLQCAKCHNHPFDRWTQDDYYNWSAAFARIDYKVIDNQRKDKLDKHEFVGEQIVLVGDAGKEIQNPRTKRIAEPKMLGGPELGLEGYYERLEPIAQWLTDPANDRFATMQVNFIWYHLVGRGLVEPIDDFRATNPASHPALLQQMAREFIASGYDLRHVARSIILSRMYRSSSLSNETNVDDEVNYSRSYVKRYAAEKVLDAQCQALGVFAEFSSQPIGTRAGQLPGVPQIRRKRDAKAGEGDRFLRQFGKSARLLACECERSNETTLTQALVLTSGEGINQRLSESGNIIDELTRSSLTTPEILDRLYWTALSRGPTDEERQAAEQALSNEPDRQLAWQDILWSLVTSKEFLFRH